MKEANTQEKAQERNNALDRGPSRTQAGDQERHIAEMREFLKPSPVRIGHIPNWFRRALLKVFGCRNGDTSAWAVLHHSIGNASWMDHYGSTTLSDGRKAFVSEPYQFSPEEAADVDRLAKMLGCQWWPTANSWWFPGRTARIVFAPRVQQ